MDIVAFKKVKGPFGWMSNMSPHAVEHGGLTWRTTEALFQALRFDDEAVRMEIHAQKSPMAAKMVAKRYSDKMIIEQRGPVDMANMRMVLALKLGQHPSLLVELLGTEDALIIEDCTNRPHGSGLFWGAALVQGEWHGENALGKLWMEIRGKKRILAYQNRCCDNEDRTMDGGCRNCGDPSF